MRPSRIKAKLARNEPVLVTTLHLTDPSLFELTSLMGFDGIWMDLEHHAYSVETAENLIRAARVGGADILARPAKGEFMRIGRLLEAGAHGIMYPRCDSVEEAQQVICWTKFAPLGERGFCGGNADMPYCAMPIDEYVRQANAETFVVIQIEDAASVQQAEQIAALEGVDVLFLGPADFSILGGIPGQLDHSTVQDAIDTIAAAAKTTGKHWGMPCFSVDHARQLLDKGARFLAHKSDIVTVKQSHEQLQTEFAELGFNFDNQLDRY